jgi:hypothetical protein
MLVSRNAFHFEVNAVSRNGVSGSGKGVEVQLAFSSLAHFLISHLVQAELIKHACQIGETTEELAQSWHEPIGGV